MKENRLRLLLFTAFGLSGMAALIYEVVWTRSLSIIMGSSTYAVSTMLAAFMAGLAVGAWVGSYLSTRLKNLLAAFALTELGIGLTGVLTIPLINYLLPIYIKSFYSFHLEFNMFSAVQFSLCFMVMGIPTTLMGMSYPLAVNCFTDKGVNVGVYAGRLYSVNTFGAIIGSVSAGFLLIPILGVIGTAIAAAIVNITVALFILLVSRNTRGLAAAAMGIMAIGFAFALLYKPVVPFFSYYSAYRFGGYDFAKKVYEYIDQSGGGADRNLVIYHHEGVDGNVYLTKSGAMGDSRYVLINNGKLEAGNDIGFALLAYLPYFTHESTGRPVKALSIGLGSGHTLKHLLELPVDKVVSVELSEGIMEANRKHLSPALFTDPRVKHVIADGRNYLLINPDKYDIILASPSWAVEAASAGMLTHEFFSLAASRLDDHGTFAVWVDDFIESDDDLDMILRTASTSFKHVTLWESVDGMILVASQSQLLLGLDKVYQQIAAISPEIKNEYGLLVNEDDSCTFGPGPINTDDRPLVEFDNAKSIITGSGEGLYKKSKRRG